MRSILAALLALTALQLAACGGQKPAAASGAETTPACCDSVGQANCCLDSAATDSSGYPAPEAAADTAAGSDASGECST